MEDIFGAIVVIIGIIAALVNVNIKRKKHQQEQWRVDFNNFPTPPQPAAAAVQETSQLRTEPFQAAQPTVHTHLTLDCDVHDASGSLNVDSPEGKDPCHDEQLAARDLLPEAADAAPSLTLDWSGEAMVKAFVMQEVLTRPSQRRAR